MAGESAREYARSQFDKAARHKRVADRYERGADGEHATAEALAPLEAQGWVVRHDLAWPARPRANIDHVVIGPGGVYVIDSKNWSGDVEVRGQVLRQNGYSRESTVKSIAEAADAVSAAIGGVTATAVLCFTGDRPRGEWVQDVLVCSTSSVAELLAGRPLILSPDEVDRFVRRTMITLPLATDPDARKTRAARSSDGGTSTRRPVLRRRTRRRIRSVLIRGGVAIAMIGAAAFVAPRVAPVLTDLFTKGLVAEAVNVGDSVDVTGTGERPDLSVTVVSVKDVANAGVELADGSQLLAVRVRFENTGSTAWKARSVTGISIVTTDGRTFDADPRRSTRADGTEFPGKPRVKPGKSFAGRAIFVLPKDSKAKSVRVTLDGASGTLRWGT